METQSIDSTFSKYKRNKKLNNKLIFLHFQKKKQQEIFVHFEFVDKKLQIEFLTTEISFIIMISCLCVGPKNSGKTMLLTSIQYPDSVNYTTHSVNTVGTNIFTINYVPSAEKKSLKKNAKKNITVRELGGEMAVMWKNYYSEAVNKIIFVVDTSNLCQISCAGEILFSGLIKTFPFLSISI